MYRVFMSYNRRDEAQVIQIAQALKSRQVRIWSEDKHILSGQNWKEEIKQAMRTCAATVVCIGDHGLGYWQRREIQAALDLQAHRETQIIPVLLEGSSPDAMPVFLETLRWVDFREGISQMELDILAYQLQRLIGEKRLTLSPTIEPGASITNQTPATEQSSKRAPIPLSESCIAFYLLISALAAFVLLRALTDQEIVIALGTLNIAIIGAWIWTWLSKIRMLIQAFKDTQQSELARRVPGELGNA